MGDQKWILPVALAATAVAAPYLAPALMGAGGAAAAAPGLAALEGAALGGSAGMAPAAAVGAGLLPAEAAASAGLGSTLMTGAGKGLDWLGKHVKPSGTLSMMGGDQSPPLAPPAPAPTMGPIAWPSGWGREGLGTYGEEDEGMSQLVRLLQNRRGGMW